MPAGLPTHLPLWRIVASLAIWPLLEQMVGAVVWFTDSALAGHLDPAIVKPASEAIGGAAYILWLMGIIQGAVGVGATAIVARAVGANDRDEADLAVAQTMLIAVAWGLINAGGFLAVAPYIGGLLNMTDAGAAMCRDYIMIVALVAPFRAVLFIGSACLRGAGDTRSPFFVGLVVNGVNIIISVTLIATLRPTDEWAVRYIAIGTMVAWMVGGLVMLRLLLRGVGEVKLHGGLMRPQRAMVGRLLGVGIPALAENAGHWFGNFLVIMMVGELARRGIEQYPLAAHNFAIRIEGFSFLPGFAFGIAAATLAGQYLGAGDVKTARRAIGWAWLYGTGLMTAVGLVFIFAPELLVRIVTDDPQFLADTPPLLFIAGFVQFGFGTALVLGGALRGAGDTKTTMWITFGSTFLVRLPAAWIIGVQLGYGLTGLWVALGGELMLRGVFVSLRFFQGGWTKVRV